MALEPRTDWDGLTLAFLRDPFDKAAAPGEWEERAARYASAALGRAVAIDEITTAGGALDEEIPLPDRWPALANGTLPTRHPVGGKAGEIRCGAVAPTKAEGVVEDIVAGLDDPRRRFLALWRLLPERLDAAFGDWASRLPADPRAPDHSALDRAGAAAGLWAARRGVGGGACLSFALGPVQSFIAAARSVRDLWTGSAILSWLAFRAMRPVLDRLGPTAFVYPALRGNPSIDLWLRRDAELGDRVPMPDAAARRSPSFPNRFLAIVPDAATGELARACEAAARGAWTDLATRVRDRLAPALDELSADWDRLWLAQIENLLDAGATVAPYDSLDDEALARWIGGGAFGDVWPDAAKVRALADVAPDGGGGAAGRWQARMEYSARVAEANRAARRAPAASGLDREGKSPPKCALFGSWEQMGPAAFDSARRFWDSAAARLRVKGVRLRPGERLCAVALAKRFAGPVALAGELALGPEDLRFPDTATVAAANWLADAGIDPDAVRREDENWSGRWLHDSDDGEELAKPRTRARIAEAQKAHGPPPSYLAILVMDGDDLGGWLRGDRAPPLKDVLHPDTMDDLLRASGPRAEAALAARRPVGPELQAAIGAALGQFAASDAPRIVRAHRGTVIYSGGDDLLALLPAAGAVACAGALRAAWSGDGPGAGMGAATLSAGIAYVHHMEDLRLALDAAREAEKRAKAEGRNILHLHFARRSGEHSGAALPWPLAGRFAELAELFARGASDRWTYRLRAELPVLEDDGLPDAAIEAEIRRLGDRIDDLEWTKRAGENQVGEMIAGWWEDYARERAKREAPPPRREALRQFVTLCQGAAFIARGRDR